MKITEALKVRKHLTEQIKRNHELRNENFYIFVPKTVTMKDVRENPEKFDITTFKEITDNIDEIEWTLLDLREKMMRTNVDTIVTIPENFIVKGLSGKKMSLAKLKLIIDKYRSNLAQLMNLRKEGRYDRKSASLSTEDEEKKIPQLKGKEIEEIITKLEDEKRKLETLLEGTNGRTEVIGIED